MYSDYGRAFDWKGTWNFVNGFAMDVVIFDADNSPSSHANNLKIKVLGESPTYVINGSFGAPEKNFSINFSKTNIKFCLSLHYNGDPSYLFVNGKETSMTA